MRLTRATIATPGHDFVCRRRLGAGHARGRLYAARRHAVDQGRRDDLPDYTYQTTRRSRTPTATRSTRARSTSPAPTSTSPATSRTSSRSASRRTSRARAACDAGRRRTIVNGSLVFRVKYAFAQFNLDDWMTEGLVGALRHPADAVGRLRGRHLPLPVPGHDVRRARRLLDSADAGVSFHYNFPTNYGDVHVGVYNGESYSEAGSERPEGVRDSRHGPAVRASRRRCCAACASPVLRRRPLRQGRRPRTRAVGQRDLRAQVRERRLRLPRRARSDVGHRKPTSKANGYSFWVTPKMPHENGSSSKALLRYDHCAPNDGRRPTRRASARSSASPTGSRTRATCRRRCCSTTTARRSTTSCRRSRNSRRSPCMRWSISRASGGSA